MLRNSQLQVYCLSVFEDIFFPLSFRLFAIEQNYNTKGLTDN
jgi:hypothetical protein